MRTLRSLAPASILLLAAGTLHADALSAAPSARRSPFRAAVYQCRPRPSLADDGGAGALRALTAVADALRRASEHGVELVVFPELFLQGVNDGSDDDDASYGKAAVDREGYELGVTGQLCGELGVACVLPYAEKPHESESTGDDDDKGKCYSSAAVFHADGRRAVNYRRTNFPPTTTRSSEDEGDDDDPQLSVPTASSGAFLRGSHLVESLPFALDLKGGVTVRGALATSYDLEASPEHCRQLARSGAEVLLVPGSIGGGSGDGLSSWGERVARCVIPARAMENGVHVLCANYEGSPPVGGTATTAANFVGLSTIVSPDGEELIRAPPPAALASEDGEAGDEDAGRVVTGTEGSSIIPCEGGGELYVCNIDVDAEAYRSGTAGGRAFVRESLKRWDVTPKRETDALPSLGKKSKSGGEEGTSQSTREKSSKGFGSADPKAKQKNKKRRKNGIVP